MNLLVNESYTQALEDAESTETKLRSKDREIAIEKLDWPAYLGHCFYMSLSM